MIPALISQIIRFSFVGLISTGVDYGGFLLLHRVMGLQYLISSTLSYSVGIFVNYWLSMRFVFESNESRSKTTEFGLYTALTLVGLILNQMAIFAFVEWAGAPPSFGKLAAIAVVMTYNFISRKAFIEPRANR
mgnify:CR=1 FL=1